MRRSIILLTTTACLIGLGSGGGQAAPKPADARAYMAPGSCDGKPATFHSHRYRALIRKAYDFTRLPSLTPWTAEEKRAWQIHRTCLSGSKARKALDEYRASTAAQYRSERRSSLLLTPYDCGSYGRYAIPCGIVYRESGYDCQAKNPTSSAGGCYQIIDSSWEAYGGSDNDCYHVAACAPRTEQDEIASKMWAGGSGSSHWAATL